MLGYGIKDIFRMQNTLEAIIEVTNDETIKTNLEDINDLLEGIVQEGHIYQ
jgi:hypothetical protein